MITMNAPTIATFVTLFALAGIAGAAVTFAVHLNKQNEEISRVQIISQNLGAYRRLVRLTDIDPQARTIGAEVIDPGRQTPFTRVVFSVTDDTTIERQDPIIENNTVVGFSPIESITLADISENTEALVRLYASETGELRASNIVIGTPFPLP